VALLVMDLDRFKDVNDTLGHGHGDALLQSIAERLRTALRGSDTVARLGGDEFAILLAGSVDADGATRVARTLLKALEAPFTVNGQAVDARASIGIALYPDHGVDAGELMRRADVAMYVAKRTRVGHAVYAPHQDERSMGRLALLGELRHAIVHEELELHYQPKLDLRTGRVCGVEALIRWRHPCRGLVQPAGFMPLVEESELMAPLTWWLLNDALGQVRAWRDSGLDLDIAVNLSPRNLQDHHLAQSIVELLRLWRVPADRLTLELTENVVMAAGATEVLRPLQEMGVRLSIDDFGTGYSSLAYLKRLPVAELKIDRSFVTDLACDADDAAIVGPTIALGHNLGLEVVAEGVEDGSSLRMLGEHGCDVVQGFYICPPLPAAELTAWLRGSPWLRGAPWHASPVAVSARG
jgi:diguanylate cyclase (GGDEF)-like protein